MMERRLRLGMATGDHYLLSSPLLLEDFHFHSRVFYPTNLHHLRIVMRRD
jgi:hypothetical protein